MRHNDIYADGSLNVQETFELKYFQRLINQKRHIELQNDLISFLKLENLELKEVASRSVESKEYDDLITLLNSKDEFIKYLKSENEDLKQNRHWELEFNIRKADEISLLNEKIRILEVKNRKLSNQLGEVAGRIYHQNRRLREKEVSLTE